MTATMGTSRVCPTPFSSYKVFWLLLISQESFRTPSSTIYLCVHYDDALNDTDRGSPGVYAPPNKLLYSINTIIKCGIW